MPFSELIFAKKFLGPPDPTGGRESPVVPTTHAALGAHHDMAHHFMPSCLTQKKIPWNQKFLKEYKSLAKTLAPCKLTLITRSTFESVGIFQWLNPEIGKPFFFLKKWAFLKNFFSPSKLLLQFSVPLFMIRLSLWQPVSIGELIAKFSDIQIFTWLAGWL